MNFLGQLVDTKMFPKLLVEVIVHKWKRWEKHYTVLDCYPVGVVILSWLLSLSAHISAFGLAKKKKKAKQGRMVGNDV